MKEDKVREALAELKNIKRTRTDEIQAAIDLFEEALNPQRFYKWQPVLVSDNGEDWVKAFIDDKDQGSFRAVHYGAHLGKHYDNWKHCKPDPEAVSLPNWIPYDPNIDPIQIEPSGAKLIFHPNDDYYCIIPLPEFIE